MKKILNTLVLSTCIFAFIFSSCGNKEEEELEFVNVEKSGNTLKIHENSAIISSIEEYEIHKSEHSNTREFTGKIQAPIGTQAIVHPPFPGKVNQVQVRLGQNVQKGTVLFYMENEEVFELQENFNAAKKEYELAKLKFKRQEELLNHGIISQQEFEDEQREYHVFKLQFDQIKANLKLWNIPTNDLQIGHSLPIVSPITGQVLKMNVAPGMYLLEPDDAEIIIGNTKDLWIQLLLKPREIKGIKEGQNVEVWNEVKESWEQAKVRFISFIVDEEHKHIEVYIDLSNKNQEYHLGAINKVRIHNTTDKEGWIIPSSALLQDDEAFVFVKTDNNTYKKQFVEVESLNKDQLLVTKGLKKGDIIIAKGAIYLLEYL